MVFDSIVVFITTILLSVFIICAPEAYRQKAKTDITVQDNKTEEKNISKLCIPDEPERKVTIEGIIGKIIIETEVTIPPGPLRICEMGDGTFQGDGGGIGSVFWYQGSISGEYVEDSEKTNRIKITVEIYPSSSEPEGLKKEYLLLVSDLPRTFVDNNSNVTFSVIKDSAVQKQD
jgi:hypothetical protein